jgi:transposase InsO family protein
MPSILQVLAVVLASRLNRHQQRVLEYLQDENRILKRQLRGRRLRLTDTDRARLAVRGMALGRRVLDQFASIVTPETILRWHRTLIANKWTFPCRRPSRQDVMRKITALVLRMERENPLWGYDRIVGALANLGHQVAPTTVRNILKAHGIDPAPARRMKTPWRQFLRAQFSSIAAADFFTTEVWTASGLVTWYTFFVIDLATRAVEIFGSTSHPGEAFMKQVARNLTDAVDGVLAKKRFLILDRDTKFSDAFCNILKSAGIRVILCPPRAPNCNAFAERFVRSIKSERLARMILIGGGSLRNALTECVAHYNRERNHQGIGNRLFHPRSTISSVEVPVSRSRRLVGLLNFHERRAA